MEFKKKTNKDESIGLRLKAETLKLLKALAKEHKLTQSEVIRQLIEKYSQLIQPK